MALKSAQRTAIKNHRARIEGCQKLHPTMTEAERFAYGNYVRQTWTELDNEATRDAIEKMKMLSLEIIHRVRLQGYTLDQMAAYCKCSHTNIHLQLRYYERMQENKDARAL